MSENSEAGKARILVVDDEREITEMLSRHFRFLGYEVETENNPLKALETLRSKKKEVLITDLMMPEMNGLDLIKTVRREQPLIRIVVITGYVTLNNAMDCLRHGAEALIPKPLEDMGDLERSVEKAVETVNAWVSQLKRLTNMKSKENS